MSDYSKVPLYYIESRFDHPSEPFEGLTYLNPATRRKYSYLSGIWREHERIPEPSITALDVAVALDSEAENRVIARIYLGGFAVIAFIILAHWFGLFGWQWP